VSRSISAIRKSGGGCAAIAVVFLALLAAGCAGRRPQPARDLPAVDPLLRRLQALPGVEVAETPPDSGYASAWRLVVEQPLDHNHSASGRFGQRVLLSHRGFDRPMVLITEGYAIGHNYCAGLADILDANQLRVEHRYFGDSKPDSMDWRYLDIDQAAADMHRIVAMLKALYGAKWVGAGWSKGGQTSLIYRSRYPDDVSATVAFDAPLNLALEEPRIDAFFEAVGDSACRARLIRFQRLALRRKDELLPLFHWYAEGKGYSYSVGEEKALEYIVLEYPFSFWQYRDADCDGIPGEDATADEIMEHLRDVVSFWSYSDHAMNSASMYQFCWQLGYYGYVTRNVADLLSDTDYPNCAYAPQDTGVEYDPEPMRRLKDWLEKNGNNIVYLYGALDPWSAPFVDTSSYNNARTYFLQGGNHFTFIETFPPQTREEIVNLLNGWIE
jgi:pimeloyl-ACP methyl ester carboxylesterase